MSPTNDPFMVLWDPPINKGTVGKEFATEEAAERWADEHLRVTGWPMNIRVLRRSEVQGYYRPAMPDGDEEA